MGRKQRKIKAGVVTTTLQQKNALGFLPVAKPETNDAAATDAPSPPSNVLAETKGSHNPIKELPKAMPKQAKSRDKKPSGQPEMKNKLMTDFFPIRRSARKQEEKLVLEKTKEIEETILSGKEDDFEVKAFPMKGRGVVSTKPLKKGDFVLEYHGDLIGPEKARKREAEYAQDENIGCYMYYFTLGGKKYCIDATEESGRLGRLVNHSRKNANLRTKYLMVQNVPRLVLIALRDIEPGEELLYDYGDHSRQSLEAHPWLAL